jgi:hypothetical protein
LKQSWATVKEQAAQIQKVSAQLEATKPAPQVVNNPQAAAFHNQPSRFTVRRLFVCLRLRLFKLARVRIGLDERD